VDVARLFEGGADAADAAVHHVGRRDDVDASLRLHQRLLHQHVERYVVEDVARLVDDAVLSVRGVRVERDVGHDPQAREARLERRHRARHQALRV